MTSIISVRTDTSINPGYAGYLLWATCTTEKNDPVKAITDAPGCPGYIDTYQKAGKAVRLYSNRKGRSFKDKLDFADWLFRKGNFQYPKVLVLTDEMRQSGISPRRLNELAAMALEAAGASQDPNEKAAGVVAVANVYAGLGQLDKGQAQLISLQNQYCHYAGSATVSDGKKVRTVETDHCYNREDDYSAVVWKIVDKQLFAGQYEEAFKTVAAVPMSPNLRTDLYLMIAGKGLDEKADVKIAQRSLKLATVELAAIKDKATKDLYQKELDKLKARAK